MKKCLFLFLSFYSVLSFAQLRSPDSLRAKIFELEVKTIPGDSLKLPFEAIKVIDGRLDTSKLGFGVNQVSSLLGNKYFLRILLKQGIEKGIENFYNHYYQHNFTCNGKTLVISIRKLWINSMPITMAKGSGRNLKMSSEQDIYAKFEYYIGSGNVFLPLKRVDTVFQLTPLTKIEDYNKKEEGKLPFLCFALEKMVENVNYQTYINYSREKKKMTIEDIENYNAKIKNIPILTEPIKKGVFMTFDEFKNNLPSVTIFSKRKLRRNIFEIVDKKDNTILHYYAYYDGTTFGKGKPLSSLSHKLLQNHDVLYKVGNSFQFYETHIMNGNMQTTINDINGYSTNIPIFIPDRSILRVPRQIDLETGEIY
jgi:hypothetical protein